MKPNVFIVTLALAASFAAHAQEMGHGMDHDHSGMTAQAGMSSGEIRKIDKETGKLTIRHGPLANLGMPAMTMVFRVAEPGMFEGLQVGDKIDFLADRVDGQLTVIQLRVKERAN